MLRLIEVGLEPQKRGLPTSCNDLLYRSERSALAMPGRKPRNLRLLEGLRRIGLLFGIADTIAIAANDYFLTVNNLFSTSFSKDRTR
jgi:hypothetical protein